MQKITTNSTLSLKPKSQSAISTDVHNYLKNLSKKEELTSFVMHKRWYREIHTSALIVNAKNFSLIWDFYKQTSFPSEPHILTNLEEVADSLNAQVVLVDWPSKYVEFELPMDDFQYDEEITTSGNLDKYKVTSSIEHLMKNAPTFRGFPVGATIEEAMYLSNISKENGLYKNRIYFANTNYAQSDEAKLFKNFFKLNTSYKSEWNFPEEMIHIAKLLFTDQKEIGILMPYSSASDDLKSFKHRTSLPITITQTRFASYDLKTPGISLCTFFDEKNVAKSEGDKSLLE